MYLWIIDSSPQFNILHVTTISRKHSLKTLNLKAKKMNLSGWIAEKIKMSKSPEYFCLLMGGKIFSKL